MARSVRINPPVVDHTTCAHCTRLAEEIEALRSAETVKAILAIFFEDADYRGISREGLNFRPTSKGIFLYDARARVAAVLAKVGKER